MSELVVSTLFNGAICELYQLDFSELTVDVQSLRTHHFPKQAVKVGMMVKDKFYELPDKAKFIHGKKYVVIVSDCGEESKKSPTEISRELTLPNGSSAVDSIVGGGLQAFSGSSEDSSFQPPNLIVSLPNFTTPVRMEAKPESSALPTIEYEQVTHEQLVHAADENPSTSFTQNEEPMDIDVVNEDAKPKTPRNRIVPALGAITDFPKAKWRTLNLVELLNCDKKTERVASELLKGTNVSADYGLRGLLVKKMGKYLMANAEKPNNPSRAEIRAFLQHCLRPYGVTTEPYCSISSRGYLGEFIHNQRRGLKGVTEFRHYKKKNALLLASDDDKANSATLKDLPPGSGAWKSLLDKTFNYRIACIASPKVGVSACFLEFPFLFTDSSVILSDFCRKYDTTMENLSLAWRNFSVEIRKYCEINLKEESELACELNDLSEPGKYAYNSILMTFAALQKITKRKVSRVKYLFNSYAEETDVESCMAKLKRIGLTQPSILQVGLRGKLYIILEGVAVRVDGAISTAIFASFAFFFMLDLKYPSQISDFWQIIEPLAGISSGKPSNGAKVLIDALNIGVHANISG